MTTCIIEGCAGEAVSPTRKPSFCFRHWRVLPGWMKEVLRTAKAETPDYDGAMRLAKKTIEEGKPADGAS